MSRSAAAYLSRWPSYRCCALRCSDAGITPRSSSSAVSATLALRDSSSIPAKVRDCRARAISRLFSQVSRSRSLSRASRYPACASRWRRLVSAVSSSTSGWPFFTRSPYSNSTFATLPETRLVTGTSRRGASLPTKETVLTSRRGATVTVRPSDAARGAAAAVPSASADPASSHTYQAAPPNRTTTSTIASARTAVIFFSAESSALFLSSISR